LQLGKYLVENKVENKVIVFYKIIASRVDGDGAPLLRQPIRSDYDPMKYLLQKQNKKRVDTRTPPSIDDFLSVQIYASDDKKLSACDVVITAQEYYLRKSRSEFRDVYPRLNTEDWANTIPISNRLSEFLDQTSNEELIKKILKIFDTSVENYSFESILLNRFCIAPLFKKGDGFIESTSNLQMDVLNSLSKAVCAKTPFNDDADMFYRSIYNTKVFNWLDKMVRTINDSGHMKTAIDQRKNLISVVSGLADCSGYAKDEVEYSQVQRLIVCMNLGLSIDERFDIMSGIRGALRESDTSPEFCVVAVRNFLKATWAVNMKQSEDVDQSCRDILSTLFLLVKGNSFDKKLLWNEDALGFYSTSDIKEMVLDIAEVGSTDLFNEGVGVADGESNGGIIIYLALALFKQRNSSSFVFSSQDLAMIFKNVLFSLDNQEYPVPNFLDILKLYVGDGALSLNSSHSNLIIDAAIQVFESVGEAFYKPLCQVKDLDKLKIR
jgi:hypothetical protein